MERINELKEFVHARKKLSIIIPDDINLLVIRLITLEAVLAWKSGEVDILRDELDSIKILNILTGGEQP